MIYFKLLKRIITHKFWVASVINYANSKSCKQGG